MQFQGVVRLTFKQIDIERFSQRLTSTKLYLGHSFVKAENIACKRYLGTSTVIDLFHNNYCVWYTVR
jgi:hypothetical protein